MALRPPQPWTANLTHAAGATPNSMCPEELLGPHPEQPEQSARLIMEGNLTLRYHAGAEAENSAHSRPLIRVNSGTFWRTFS
ncbi:hypothetical protein CEE69_17545 [Rhodopirellula bahusiensis]|uniref:Uncharacterized protein n=1 Tax=Rhodopirellula bahusiensis TaxID=2014065 RepID=A0A2G1W672_9BACT|nr:hypothetical protein CEE69_17545 [Rhodopirellula bahusiensis]